MKLKKKKKKEPEIADLFCTESLILNMNLQ